MYDISTPEKYRIYNHTKIGSQYIYYIKDTKFLIFQHYVEDSGFFFDLTKWEINGKFSREFSRDDPTITTGVFFLVPDFRRDKYLISIYSDSEVIMETYDMSNKNKHVGTKIIKKKEL